MGSLKTNVYFMIYKTMLFDEPSNIFGRKRTIKASSISIVANRGKCQRLSSIAMSNSREFILLVFISEPLQSLVVI
jgi:hypothetical protein